MDAKRHREKRRWTALYGRFDRGEQWQLQHKGFLVLKYDETLKGVYFFLHAKADNSVLFSGEITSKIEYGLEQDTFIVWIDPGLKKSLAFSFTDKGYCQEIWHQLLLVKQGVTFRPVRQEGMDWEIPFSELELGSLVAEGGYSEVYKGAWKGRPVAIKMMKCRVLDDSSLKEFDKEVSIMRKLSHPNIVNFVGACTDPLCILTEFYANGNLWVLLRKKASEFTWERIHRTASELAQGMNYLHNEVNLIHRDLKSPNVLMDAEWNVKIADFGFTRVKSETQKMTGQRGTPEWMSPEVVRSQWYSEKADVYSYGIILWELVVRQKPFTGKRDFFSIVTAVIGGERPPLPTGRCPDAYCELMEKCWDADPEKRPGFEAVLACLSQMMRK